MRKRIRHWFSPIPRNLRDAFLTEITWINLERSIVISIALFFIELVLLGFEDLFYDAGMVIFAFLIASIIQIPLLLLTYRYRMKIKRSLIQIQIFIYLITVVLFGIGLSLRIQPQVDLVHMFLMATIGIAAFVYLDLSQSTLLFTFAYVSFALLLPYYQTDATALFVTRVNALVFIFLAWLLNRMIYRLKIDSFVTESELKEKNRILEEMNQRDPMTGLYNHTSSFRMLFEETAKAKRIGYPITLILCDVDDFKQVNDTYGHTAGDHVLLRLSKTISATIRATDIVGRYGGEEFIIVLPDTDVNDARVLSERLEGAIAKTVYDFNVKITMSGGICQYDANQTIDEWIRSADQRRYEAKRRGKNRFESGQILEQVS